MASPKCLYKQREWEKTCVFFFDMEILYRMISV
jgi:hypothetical protein